MEGREREGPKLLLNQGPSESCYAIDPEERRADRPKMELMGH